jgi:SAM-dependent methyltransferase
MIHPLRIYGQGLLGGDPLQARLRDGTVLAVAVDRYVGQADQTDERLLATVQGPVLDVGCGPGRHLHALARRGVFALGVDLSPIAVAMARGRGARAIVASIFDELPGAGSWRAALLLDGNIGIGGEPARLLARVATLLARDGSVVVELEPPSGRTMRTHARLESADRTSAWFPWARVAAPDAPQMAAAAGFRLVKRWSAGGRWFARLVRA